MRFPLIEWTRSTGVKTTVEGNMRRPQLSFGEKHSKNNDRMSFVSLAWRECLLVFCCFFSFLRRDHYYHTENCVQEWLWERRCRVNECTLCHLGKWFDLLVPPMDSRKLSCCCVVCPAVLWILGSFFKKAFVSEESHSRVVVVVFSSVKIVRRVQDVSLPQSSLLNQNRLKDFPWLCLMMFVCSLCLCCFLMFFFLPTPSVWPSHVFALQFYNTLLQRRQADVKGLTFVRKHPLVVWTPKRTSWSVMAKKHTQVSDRDFKESFTHSSLS